MTLTICRLAFILHSNFTMTKARKLPKKRTKGKGLGSWLKKKATQVKDFVVNRLHFEPRKGATARFNAFLKQEGSQTVTQMRIGRKPVHAAVQAFLNVISLGDYERMKHTLHYDNVYHNYIIVSLSDGRTYRLEKNHVVEHDGANRSDGEFDIPLNGRKITLQHVIDTASKGDEEFWRYHPASNNCQVFVNNILQRNHLTTSDPLAQDYLKPQNGKKLLSTLPGVLGKIPKLLTDVAGVGDRVVHGDGLHTSNRR